MASNRPTPETTDIATRQLAASFAPGELAIVCSHYELGVIRSIRPLAGGSASSPKVRIDTTTGTFLLKRREPGRDDPFTVALSHSIQIHLASRGFPLARLIGTRGENNSMLQLHGRIYELFDFTNGDRYAGSPEQTVRAGAALAWFHAAVADHASEWTAPRGSFHNPGGIDDLIARVGHRMSASAAPTLDRLRALYHEAAAALERHGYGRLPAQLIHGDWHPGNLLYAGDRVLTVLDFDSVRLGPRIADVAGGGLQFSMMAGGRPEDWPAEADLARLGAFVAGYDSNSPGLPDGERAMVPALMIEAVIVEALAPVASTGRFGDQEAEGVLRTIGRKAAWPREHASALVETVRTPGMRAAATPP